MPLEDPESVPKLRISYLMSSVMLALLILAIPTYRSGLVRNPSIGAIMLLLAPLPLIYVGEILGERFPTRAIVAPCFVLSVFLYWRYLSAFLNPIFSIILAILLPPIIVVLARFFSVWSWRRAAVALLAMALGFALAGGIPIIDYQARLSYNTSPLRFLAFLGALITTTAGALESDREEIFLIFPAIFSLTGFRMEPLAMLASYSIVLILKRKIPKLLATFAMALIIATGVGWLVIQSKSWQQWRIEPYELLSYRAAFTIWVFSKIAQSSGEGCLTILSPPRSRVLVTERIFGYEESLSYTLLGGILYDLGMLGYLMSALLLGYLLGSLATISSDDLGMSLYISLCSILLVLVEGGIDFGGLALISTMGWLLPLRNNFPLKSAHS